VLDLSYICVPASTDGGGSGEGGGALLPDSIGQMAVLWRRTVSPAGVRACLRGALLTV
jgi:hypothetical protein